MTELDKHVGAAGRDELVKKVRHQINDLGIQYIYYQFVSVTGRVVGKGIPADHWERTAERGFQLVYGATANLFTDRHRNYIGYGAEASELVGIPDPETFCQLPWDKRVARVFCTLFRNREEKDNPGGFLTSDCRGNLRRIHEQFKADHGGLHMRHGCEPEMMWLTKGPDGLPAGGVTKPNCYHIDQFESLRPVFMRAIEYGRAMGLDMIQGDHEDAPGQLELNFMFDDALRTADRLTTYRQICAQVAREFNLIACFMSKPFMGVSASGCHHNVSLWRGGNDVTNMLGHQKLPGSEHNFKYLTGGENTFLPLPGQAKLLDRQLVPPAVGHGLLGAGVRRLGLSEPYLRASHLGAGPLRVPLGGLCRQSVSDGGRHPAGVRRRHQEQGGAGRAGGTQHLSGDGGRQEGQEASDVAWRGARGARARRGREVRDAGRHVPRLHAL
jgi:glutamine synthetase